MPVGKHTPGGLDGLALLAQVGEQRVVVLVEDRARDGVQARHDVPRACRVLAALQPRPELPCSRRHASIQRTSHGLVRQLTRFPAVASVSMGGRGSRMCSHTAYWQACCCFPICGGGVIRAACGCRSTGTHRHARSKNKWQSEQEIAMAGLCS